MKKLVFLVFLVVIIFGLSSGLAKAFMLDFEDLYPSIPVDEQHLYPITNYGGFSWDNMGAITREYSPGSGYDLGTIGRVSIFTGYSNPLSMSRANPFTLRGAYVTSAWFQDNEFTAEGWLGGQLKYTQTFATSNDAAHWFDFNFNNIDTVVFKPKYSMYNGYFAQNGHLAIDGINVVPEPISAALFLLGGGVLAVRQYRKKKNGLKTPLTNQERRVG